MPAGKAPYDEDLTSTMKNYWYPNIYNQLSILNAIVESGPFVPKYSETKNSTWELDMFYTFLFKWGGPETPEPAVADPQLQGTYEVPDTIQNAVQIRDPSKQKAASLLHPWDIRHGYFTKSALKRMYENLSIDSTFASDTEHRPKKKKRQTGPELSHPQEEEEDLQASLLSLCEENIYQETTPQNLRAAHQTAAATAAGAQVQHPQNNIRFERQTKPSETTNRSSLLTRFKPGFEQQTERELSIIFS